MAKPKEKYTTKPIRKWKYEDDERDMGDLGVECYDCGLDYDGGKGWCDVGIPHEAWELINPTHHRGSGLLCFTCMARRLTFLGLEDVPVFIGSGPFKCNDPTDEEVKVYFPPTYRRGE